MRLALALLLLACAGCAAGVDVRTDSEGLDPAAYPGVYGTPAFGRAALPATPMPTPWDNDPRERDNATLDHIFGR